MNCCHWGSRTTNGFVVLQCIIKNTDMYNFKLRSSGCAANIYSMPKTLSTMTYLVFQIDVLSQIKGLVLVIRFRLLSSDCAFHLVVTSPFYKELVVKRVLLINVSLF